MELVVAGTDVLPTLCHTISSVSSSLIELNVWRSPSYEANSCTTGQEFQAFYRIYSLTSTQETMADPHPETDPVHILCKFRINVILPPMPTNYLFNLLKPSGYVMHQQV